MKGLFRGRGVAIETLQSLSLAAYGGGFASIKLIKFTFIVPSKKHAA